MEYSLLPVLIGLTSVSAYVIGTRGLHRRARGLPAALRRMFEAVGWMLIFLVANLGLGLLLILSIRGLTGRFVSVYLLTDVAWLGLAGLQGLAFHAWLAEWPDKPAASPPAGRRELPNS